MTVGTSVKNCIDRFAILLTSQIKKRTAGSQRVMCWSLLWKLSAKFCSDDLSFKGEQQSVKIDVSRHQSNIRTWEDQKNSIYGFLMNLTQLINFALLVKRNESGPFWKRALNNGLFTIISIEKKRGASKRNQNKLHLELIFIKRELYY